MDLKQKYREEKNTEPYCWTKSGQYVKSGSYSDGYVKWLEQELVKKCNLPDVSDSFNLKDLIDAANYYQGDYDIDEESIKEFLNDR